jgi:hypothetical protein
MYMFVLYFRNDNTLAVIGQIAISREVGTYNQNVTTCNLFTAGLFKHRCTIYII